MKLIQDYNGEVSADSRGRSAVFLDRERSKSEKADEVSAVYGMNVSSSSAGKV